MLLGPYKDKAKLLLTNKDQDIQAKHSNEDQKPPVISQHQDERAVRVKRANEDEERSKNSKLEAGVVPSLVPVQIDGVTPKAQSRLFGIEKPLASKLHSTLMGNMSKERDSENEAHLRGRPVGRKLQYYTSRLDRGFLPWEKRKFFQDLLEVRHGSTIFFFFFFELKASHTYTHTVGIKVYTPLLSFWDVKNEVSNFPPLI